MINMTIDISKWKKKLKKELKKAKEIMEIVLENEKSLYIQEERFKMDKVYVNFKDELEKLKEQYKQLLGEAVYEIANGRSPGAKWVKIKEVEHHLDIVSKALEWCDTPIEITPQQ